MVLAVRCFQGRFEGLLLGYGSGGYSDFEALLEQESSDGSNSINVELRNEGSNVRSNKTCSSCRCELRSSDCWSYSPVTSTREPLGSLSNCGDIVDKDESRVVDPGEGRSEPVIWGSRIAFLPSAFPLYHLSYAPPPKTRRVRSDRMTKLYVCLTTEGGAEHDVWFYSRRAYNGAAWR